MKKFLPLLLIPALSACNILGLPNGDVMGQIAGTPAKAGPIKIAITSLTTAGVISDTPDQLTVGTFNEAKKLYSISLPGDPANGLYTVYAYTDVNGNNKYDLLSESRTQLTNQFLRYTAGKGWEMVKDLGLTVVKSGTPFTDYNLSW